MTDDFFDDDIEIDELTCLACGHFETRSQRCELCGGEGVPAGPLVYDLSRSRIDGVPATAAPLASAGEILEAIEHLEARLAATQSAWAAADALAHAYHTHELDPTAANSANVGAAYNAWLKARGKQ
jgi:hypothetical protein